MKQGGASTNEIYIKPNPNDPDSSIESRVYAHELPETNKISDVRRLRRVAVAAECCLSVAILLVPLSVHVGVLSSLSTMWVSDAKAAVITEVSDESPASVTLLSSTIHPDPQAIGGGEVIAIDGSLQASGPVGSNTIATSPTRSNEISVYTVREGDSLSQIAQMYGVTTNTIMWANDLTRATSISAGDTLVILPVAGVQHTIKEGETLTDIVDKYDADYDEVTTFNQLLDAETLEVGSDIIIPGAELQTKVVTNSAAAARSGSWLSHPAPGATRTQGIHGYNGVDYGGAPGSAIKAAASGEVIIAKASGWNGGYGQYVVIKHSNGVQTLYSHLNGVYVGVGDWVTVGTTIGAMGNTGRSTGTHLHFEVRGGSNPF